MLKKLSLPLLLALPALASAAPKKIEADVLFKGATVVDVAQGRLLKGKAVLVRGDRILAVVDEKKLGAFKAGKTVHLPGRFIMPGLWDSHVHFGGDKPLEEDNRRLMPLYLAHGITSVRDCAGDSTDTVLQWRADIAAGRMQGPTIFLAGAKLEGYKPLWKGTIEVGTPEEVGRALDGLKAQQVDFVKITENTMTPEIYLDALRQARARGMKTSAHLAGQVTLAQASEAGLGTVEHLSYLVRAATPREAELTAQVTPGAITGRAANEQSLASFDEATARAAFKKLAATGTAVVPTLSISRVIAYLDQDDHAKDDYLKYIGPKMRATYEWRVKRAALDSPAAIAYRHAFFERSASLLPLLAQAGVPIIAGTDAGWLNSFDYPGQALHDELAVYVKYGLTPTQALQSAVLAGPRFLGKLDQYGDLASGKKADLVVLDANPLADIGATRKIRGVMSKGRWMDRAALDGMLAEVEQWVKEQPQWSRSKSSPAWAPATLSEYDGVRFLHLDSIWVQGAMRIRKPQQLELEYIQRMMAWMLWRESDELNQGHAIQLGLGAAAITRFSHKVLRMRTTAVEINPTVISACRAWFHLPEDDKRLTVVNADAAQWVAEAEPQQAQVLNVDLYDHEAESPVLDDEGFYAACRALLAEGGLMTVNLFGRNASFARSAERIARVFGSDQVWSLAPTKEGNTVVVAARGVRVPEREELERRAANIEAQYGVHGLPARKWLRLVRPLPLSILEKVAQPT